MKMKRIKFKKSDGRMSSVSISEFCHNVLKYLTEREGITISSYITKLYEQYELEAEINFSFYLRDALLRAMVDETKGK